MKTVAELAASGAEAVVADDLPSAQKIVSRFLTRMGFRKVYQCGTAEQAYRVIMNHRHIRVVVSDVLMPDGTGHALIRRLESQDLAEPLIIVLTSLGQDEDAKPGSYRGVPLHPLKKPFSREDLAERLKSLLESLSTSSPSPSDGPLSPK